MSLGVESHSKNDQGSFGQCLFVMGGGGGGDPLTTRGELLLTGEARTSRSE